MRRPPPQLELWAPAELQVTHLRCATCLGVYRIDRGCTWCASGSHEHARAARFANGWLIAQFPETTRLLPAGSL